LNLLQSEKKTNNETNLIKLEQNTDKLYMTEEIISEKKPSLFCDDEAPKSTLNSKDNSYSKDSIEIHQAHTKRHFNTPC
jgi:hypothetical protein